MWNKDCLQYLGGRCKALTVRRCPERCSSMITNPVDYINMLEQLIYYNRFNSNMVGEYRREVAKLRREYGIMDEDEMGSTSTNFGKKGSSSEGKNRSVKRKSDNRILETKMTSEERKEYREALKEWEEEHGKLEKLGRSSLSNNKIDSYTGELLK